MKGYLLLSETRSGTNWIGSMANNTGVMGISAEWLAPSKTKGLLRKLDGSEFFDHVVQASSTLNQRFAIKIFPNHVYRINNHYQYDFIRKCREAHPVKIIHLMRRDRVGQAVSLARSQQTQQWRSDTSKEKEAVYDFPAICRAYFRAGRSNVFWQDYLAVNNIAHETYHYEDLMTSFDEYQKTLMDFLDVEKSVQWKTELKIQRDSVSLEWCDRFREDVNKHGVLDHLWPAKPEPKAEKKGISRLAGLFTAKNN